MITQIPFDEAARVEAKRFLRRLNMSNKYSFTTASDMGECYSLMPQNTTDARGNLINTKEFGILYVQDKEDLKIFF